MISPPTQTTLHDGRQHPRQSPHQGRRGIARGIEPPARLDDDDTRPARDAKEKEILAAVKSAIAGTPVGWALPEGLRAELGPRLDALLVRTESGATAEFTGGRRFLRTSYPSGSVVYFGVLSGTSAAKCCAIAYSASAGPAERERLTRSAAAFVMDHLDDVRQTGYVWNRPLFDARA